MTALFDADAYACPACEGTARIENPDGSWRSCPKCQRTAGTAARERAIRLVDEHAGGDWKAAAYAEGRRLACVLDEFTSDEILTALDARGIFTHENRAMGPVMRGLGRRGLIVSTGRYRLSDRKENHRRPQMIWRSLVA